MKIGSEMNQEISAIFKDILVETERGENIYVIGSGAPPEYGIEYTDVHRWALPEANYKKLMDSTDRLLDEINQLYVAGEYGKAINAYKILFIENLKLLRETTGLPEKEKSRLIMLLNTISEKSKDGIEAIVLAADELNINQDIIDWILGEVGNECNTHGNILNAMNGFLLKICLSSESFYSHAEKTILPDKEPETYSLGILKFNFYSENGLLENLYKLLEVNRYNFSLHGYYIEYLYNKGKIKEATAYAGEYLDFVNKEFEYLSDLKNEDYQKRINSYPDQAITYFMKCCSGFLLDILIELKEFDKAHDFVMQEFLYEYKNIRGRLDAVSRLEHFKMLADKLPEERRKRLIEDFFSHSDVLLEYEVSEICESEDYWYPMVKHLQAYKNRAWLGPFIYAYKKNKQHLGRFSDEIREAFDGVIRSYSKNAEGKARNKQIEEALKYMSKLNGSKPVIVKLLYDLKKGNTRSKMLKEFIDRYVQENGLTKEFNALDVIKA